MIGCPAPPDSKWQIHVDTGGTFTDCLAVDPAGFVHRAKVLSSSALRGTVRAAIDDRHLRIAENWGAPHDFVRGFRFRIHGPENAAVVEASLPIHITSYDPQTGILGLSGPITAPPGTAFEAVSDEEAPLLAARLVTRTLLHESLPPIEMRLATTKGTNALLERRGARVAFFVTRGFRDLLAIGDQSRPDLFTLNIRKPELLYETVVEVPERIAADGTVLQPLDLAALEQLAAQLRADGIETAAIALMHSFRNPSHEQRLEHYLRAAGFTTVSVSSHLSPFIKLLQRAETAVVDAYLAPLLNGYISRISSALRHDSSRGDLGSPTTGTKDSPLLIMTSAGGLIGVGDYRAKDSLLSGPAGGVVGAFGAARRAGFERAIAFDMGGTSTDASRCDGDLDYVFEHRVGQARLSSPALAIESVAAGGGSVCRFDRGAIRVGPESAGAMPGPACYGFGGPLTLTDVHLLLGRLAPDRFPIPIRLDAAAAAFEAVCQQVERAAGEAVDRPQLLHGFLEIANERMADAIRTVSVRQGCDPAEYCLVAFGGAGGQHACSVAGRLGIKTVISPQDAGLLSAQGLRDAQIERFAERQVLRNLEECEPAIPNWLNGLAQEAGSAVKRHTDNDVETRRRIVSLRLIGQNSTIAVEYDENVRLADAFARQYTALFGHVPEGAPVEVESIRVAVVSRVTRSNAAAAAPSATTVADSQDMVAPLSAGRNNWGDRRDTAEMAYLDRDTLSPGTVYAGPTVILDRHSATVIEPGWTGQLHPSGALVLQLRNQKSDAAEPLVSTTRELVQTELFTNRFSAIAREMGVMLRRTALSVNIKERLDFSCALLDSEGELIVNAPHIPVHLGALGLCVRTVRDMFPMGPGDVAVTNHPAFGGSHLPDITVITPVYAATSDARSGTPGAICRLIGYAASRAHHAEIGGSRPGSMPPAASTLAEEGVVIPPCFLIRQGVAVWDEIRERLTGGDYPTRAVEENMADLRAAVAANQRGAAALLELTGIYGVDRIQDAMQRIKSLAEMQARTAIGQIPNGEYDALEKMDDGSPLQVRIKIEDDSAIVDFTGSAPTHPGNLNATPAIVRSAVMYMIRLLIDEPLPLNEGLLRAIKIVLPTGMLNPDFPPDERQAPAVVGGNVETSQRLVDTLLKAMGMAACSQGTMNNLIFGNDRFGYYETVCGGSGATRTADGASAVHTHMTNTRITDSELLEWRYPVRVDQFRVRSGSGGGGQYRGGNGVIREITFLAPVDVSLLTQHRVEGPHGMRGGSSGLPGAQRIVRRSGETETLPSLAAFHAEFGDRLVLETPGGGGWGSAVSADPPLQRSETEDVTGQDRGAD